MKKHPLFCHHMTVLQIRKACKENKYIIIRFCDSFYQYGFNCKALIMLMDKENRPDDLLTAAMSYRHASLNEYICYKIPFL